MSSAAKRKGTEGENEVLDLLQTIFPDAHRTSAGTPANDIRAGWLQAVEVKWRARWLVQSWVFEQKRRKRDEWLIFVMDADRRKGDAAPNIVVWPRELSMEALRALAEKRQREAFTKVGSHPQPKFSGGIDPEFGEQLRLHAVDL